jgi:ATP-dependent HslUV protease ATP-binding subunit HslU
VGRDVESIVRDLVDVAIKMYREQEMTRVRFRAEEAAEERILDILLPPARDAAFDSSSSTRQLLRKKLREGDLADKEVEVELSTSLPSMEIMAPPGMEEMTGQLQSMFSNMSQQQSKTRKMSVKAALEALSDEEAAKLVNEDELKQKALAEAEQNGIVFIDELDKVAKRSEGAGADVSREGVQRDLLPLIEGSTVSTKHGMVKTDHILFIASGAFHMARPSDLIPELQGRLPIRVELSALTPDDFERILTEPNASLTEQYQALLATESLDVTFTQDGVRRIAETAWQVNERTENIGARRLHTVMERLLEETSFGAADTGLQDTSLKVDATYVDTQLQELSSDDDLSRFIL